MAYADWERAKSVPPAEVAKFAKRFRFKAFLLDTWGKDGKTLLDFLKPAEVASWWTSLKRGGHEGGGRRVAAAGAGEAAQGRGAGLLRGRGSACAGGKRDGVIDPARVKKWKDALK